ncbi:hypothetical protein [Deinococcus indicus]|uniref:hypothetical protein n=1 Tax=Deinococcus indicus TaxID=223556 RepID=UPI00174C5DB3|nr:hypothetical protein [Deinococcus indicus]
MTLQLQTFALTFARFVTSQLPAFHLLQRPPSPLQIRPLTFQLQPLALATSFQLRTLARLVTLAFQPRLLQV